MSIPRRKLEAPDIPGYHCHWFLEGRIPAAMQGGYKFVTTDEVSLNQFNSANDTTVSGSTDLSNRVSIVGNTQGASGQPEMLYLMKIQEEYYREDQRADDDHDAAIMSGIFRGEQIAGGDKAEQGTQYVDKDRSLFKRPTRRSTK